MKPCGYKKDVGIEHETGNLLGKGNTPGVLPVPMEPYWAHLASPDRAQCPPNTSTHISRHGIIRPLAFLSFCRWGN